MQIGELEKRVLQYLWSHKEADAKQVHAVLSRAREGSLNTLQSTLDRLYKKGLLSRDKRGHAFTYFPKVAREDLIAQLISDVTGDFVREGESSLIAAFTSASDELEDAQLEELERLIVQARAKRQQTKN